MSPITLAAAATGTQRHRTIYSTHPQAYTLPKGDLLALLQQSGCEGIRFYPACFDPGDNNNIGAVIVGYDGDDNDMTSGLLRDNVSMCPPNCSEGNELNGL